jgi:GLPGLI family protein
MAEGHGYLRYATAIPLKYGLISSFHSLPGLIIKLTDNTGDYDFEIYSLNKRGKRQTNFISDKTKETV